MLRETFPPRRQVTKGGILWALFGNDDDGIYGDDRWRAGRKKTWRLAALWWLRNPFHNLFFYVIGVADQPREFFSTREWGEPGWTFHYTKPYYLPFVSYRGWCNFYAGWRPYGAFGLKLNFAK